ncbi:pilus assembly protein PilM [Chloroflexota bacterium]
MARKVVTLDIDSNAVRLLEVKGGKVTKWGSVSLEPTSVEGEIFLSQEALSTGVKRLMATSGVSAKRVVASISGLYSVSRVVEMSETMMEGLATRQAVLEAAKEVLPLDTEELYLSWQTVAAGEGVEQVLVVGVPRDVADVEVQGLRAAGVNPYIMDLRAMALARAVDKEQAIILNIESSNFDIVIVANGMPEIMRTIAWEQGELVVEDRAEHLATNVDLTVSFYNSLNHDVSIGSATPIFVTGQISGDLSLMEKLRARLEYPFESLSPVFEYPAHLPISQYAVNIGLAMKGRPYSGNLEQGDHLPVDINFLPEVYLPWKPSVRQMYSALGVVGVVILAFFLYQATTGARAETRDMEERYNILNTELQRRQIEIKSRVPLQEALKEYRMILAMGGDFIEDLSTIRNAAEEIGVQVQSIEHVGDIITLNCQADSYVIFREFLTALEESGKFSSPVPPPEGFPFTKSGTIKLEPAANSE